MKPTRQATTALRRRLIGVFRRHGAPVAAPALFTPAWIALIVAGVGLASASAATLTVTDTSDSGAGSLRAAIASAGSADTINFDPALSGATIHLATTLDLTNNVTIDGSALATPITISGDTDNNGVGNVGVFYAHTGATVTLDSLKINQGNSNGFGGGIKNDGTLAVNHCTLSGNTGFYGGGISNNSVMTLTNSVITGNSGTYGGGIYNSGALTMTNSALSTNTAAAGGGGIYAIYAGEAFTLTIIGSTLSGNTSAGDGGGINSNATLSITASTLSGNSAAGSGGGFWSGATTLVLTSTLSGNSAGGDGGAIRSARALTVTNSTLAGNTAAGSGGGVYVHETTAKFYNASIVFNSADADANLVGSAGGIYNNDAAAATSNLRNSLMAGNIVGNVATYADCTGTVNVYGRNLLGDVTGCTVNTSNGSWTFLNSLDGLGPLQNNGGPTLTVALLPGSNAIDGGDPVLGCIDNFGNPLATDQRGLARGTGSYCDIGAFEEVIFANGFE